jgi:hypothetical protein
VQVEDEWSDESDDEWDDDSTEVIPCPACCAEVYEEAVQCPSCGTYITPDTSVWSGKSSWWIALGLLGILAVVLALVFN